METVNDNLNVKCTRCGAKATVGGKDYFYTCPVCHGQINKEAARKNHEGVSSSNQSTHVAKDEGANGGKINVKCTYCGAKAMVSDEYYLYTCPVCHRQVNTASAKSNYENQQALKDVSPEKAKVSYHTPNPVSVQTTTTKTTKSDSSISDTGALIFGIFVIILLIVFFIAFPTIGIIAAIGLVCWIVHEVNEHNGKNEKRRQKEFEQIGKEYEEAVESQKAGAPWAKRYSTHPCPHCGHYKVREAAWNDKRYSVAFWGAASSKIGTCYKCDHCGNMW